MNTTRRPLRFFWLLGLLLMLGTAVGAGWMLHRAPAQDVPSSKNIDRDRAVPGADFIMCLGHVDVRGGIIPLHPLQPGRVTHLYVHEGDAVHEGDMLLSLDSMIARSQLKEAKADLKAAREQLLKVESLRKTQQDNVKQQQEAVEAARHNAAMANNERLAEKKVFDLKMSSPEKLAVFEEKVKALQSLVRLEEAKLAAARDYNLSHDIARAQAAIDAKEAVVERARQGLLECDVYAPRDGTILGLFVNEGEPLGRDARVPAIQFCPATPRIIRAEVLQEWASKVEPGQPVTVEDDTRNGPQWQGRVTFVADALTKRRSKVFEPFQYNDVRTLECIITIDPGQPHHLRIGQRVRVRIKQGGP